MNKKQQLIEAVWAIVIMSIVVVGTIALVNILINLLDLAILWKSI